jgi:hypothetical protein
MTLTSLAICALLASWIGCGVLAAGLDQADFAHFNRDLILISNKTCRKYARADQARSLGLIITGPINLIAVLSTADYPIRGWTLHRQNCNWARL